MPVALFPGNKMPRWSPLTIRRKIAVEFGQVYRKFITATDFIFIDKRPSFLHIPKLVLAVPSTKTA